MTISLINDRKFSLIYFLGLLQVITTTKKDIVEIINSDKNDII